MTTRLLSPAPLSASGTLSRKPRRTCWKWSMLLRRPTAAWTLQVVCRGTSPRPMRRQENWGNPQQLSRAVRTGLRMRGLGTSSATTCSVFCATALEWELCGRRYQPSRKQMRWALSRGSVPLSPRPHTWPALLLSGRSRLGSRRRQRRPLHWSSAPPRLQVHRHGYQRRSPALRPGPQSPCSPRP